MRSHDELASIIEFAISQGFPSVTIDGVTYPIHAKKQNVMSTSDLKPEEIYKEVPVLDGVTEEEILYYATPYFDELQEKKKLKEENLKDEVNNG